MAIQRAIPGATQPGVGVPIGPEGRSSTQLEVTGADAARSATQTAQAPANGGGPRNAGVLDQVKQQASTRVNEQKVRAVEGLGSVASAIRQASEHLRTENQTLASYADKAVDQIQLFAERMRDKDPAEMVRDAERFARRNPPAFIGGAFVLGIALARFLKSSQSRTDDARAEGHYGPEFDDVDEIRGYTGHRDITRLTGHGAELPGSLGTATSTTIPSPGMPNR